MFEISILLVPHPIHPCIGTRNSLIPAVLSLSSPNELNMLFGEATVFALYVEAQTINK